MKKYAQAVVRYGESTEEVIKELKEFVLKEYPNAMLVDPIVTVAPFYSIMESVSILFDTQEEVQ